MSKISTPNCVAQYSAPVESEFRHEGELKNKLPAYKALLQELHSEVDRRIAAGENRRMPTGAELCAKYKVSRQTVTRAYQEMVADGVVERIPGKGTFITRWAGKSPYYRTFGSLEDVMALSLDTDMRVLSPLTTEMNESVALQLQTGPDQTVMSVEIIRFHGDRPLLISKIYLPPWLGQKLIEAGGLPESGRTSVLTSVTQLSGVEVSSVEQEITATACPLHVAQLMDVPKGQPMLLVRRKYLDPRGNPVELAVNYYDPAVYIYRAVLRTKDGSSGR